LCIGIFCCRLVLNFLCYCTTHNHGVDNNVKFNATPMEVYHLYTRITTLVLSTVCMIYIIEITIITHLDVRMSVYYYKGARSENAWLLRSYNKLIFKWATRSVSEIRPKNKASHRYLGTYFNDIIIKRHVQYDAQSPTVTAIPVGVPLRSVEDL